MEEAYESLPTESKGKKGQFLSPPLALSVQENGLYIAIKATHFYKGLQWGSIVHESPPPSCGIVRTGKRHLVNTWSIYQ